MWLDSSGKKGKIQEQLSLAACRQEVLLACSWAASRSSAMDLAALCPNAARFVLHFPLGWEHRLEELCMAKQLSVSRLLSTSRLPLVLDGGCLSISLSIRQSGFHCLWL